MVRYGSFQSYPRALCFSQGGGKPSLPRLEVAAVGWAGCGTEFESNSFYLAAEVASAGFSTSPFFPRLEYSKQNINERKK